MTRPTFVTGWFRAHGIAYLDILIAALEGANLQAHLESGSPEPRRILVDKADQYKLAVAAGYGDEHARPIKALERVVLLVPKGGDALSEPRLEELVADPKWTEVRASVARSRTGLDSRLDDLRDEIRKGWTFPSLAWLKSHWKGEEKHLWHIINAAPLKTQLAWYREHSPLFRGNPGRIVIDKLDFKDPESPEDVTREMHRWLEKEDRPGTRYLINLHGTATSVQFGWYHLTWRMPSLKDAVLLRCKDIKDARPGRRFAPVSVEVTHRDPISGAFKRPEARAGESSERSNARGILEFYFQRDDNFSLLLLGERGSGKTRAVKKAWKAVWPRRPLVLENCANFPDPIHAQSALFGHVKGAFTGSDEERLGLLERASGGLLFLDEVHHLDYTTRSMLLTALQTDTDGNSSFRKLGSDKTVQVKFMPVFASNLPRDRLRNKLEPDFLDRICQRILEWPALKADERLGAWEATWEEMKFAAGEVRNPVEAEDQEFIDWFQHQELPGNFRDINRIAILVADYQRDRNEASEGIALLGPDQSLVQYLQESYQPWLPRRRDKDSRQLPGESIRSGSRPIRIPFNPADPSTTETVFVRECRRLFARAMTDQFGSQKKAVAELRARGSGMTQSKMSRWSRGLPDNES